MPQIFQVLRCYKCLVFQIHPTKKSNKYQCKMCGEKQSIKRHYGLGSGQECRLHVQKLNALRGKTDEEEILSHKSDNSEEEFENEQNEIVHTINKFKGNKSKWSTYMDSDNKIKDGADIMDLKSGKTFSQIPQKRKKSDGFAKKHSLLPQEAFVDENVFETPCKYKYTDETNTIIHKVSKEKFCHDIPIKEHTVLNANNAQVPIQRQSKWAQFLEHEEKLKPNDGHCSENKDIHRKKETLSNNGQSFFELCDDNDLDAILKI